jgi:hypothetical protein
VANKSWEGENAPVEPEPEKEVPCAARIGHLQFTGR